jgi:hypothetical protein
MAPIPDEVTTREAMEILGLTNPSTVARYVAEGKLAASRKLPGRTGAFLFLRSDVERFRDERERAAS